MFLQFLYDLIGLISGGNNLEGTEFIGNGTWRELVLLSVSDNTRLSWDISFLSSLPSIRWALLSVRYLSLNTAFLACFQSSSLLDINRCTSR